MTVDDHREPLAVYLLLADGERVSADVLSYEARDKITMTVGRRREPYAFTARAVSLWTSHHDKPFEREQDFYACDVRVA